MNKGQKARVYMTRKRLFKIRMRKAYTIIFSVMLASLAIGGYTQVTLDDIDFTVYEVKASQNAKEYVYNERVPKDVVEAEIRKQAEQFGVNPDKAVKLAQCESGLDNLAHNKQGTATGVYQYVIATWQATNSWKVYRRAPTSYKDNIFETMIKLADGQSHHWEWCGRQ